MKSKDRNFISRMIRSLTKLETKYQVLEYKRKKRLFARKQRRSSMIPRDLASIYLGLVAPEPEAVFVPTTPVAGYMYYPNVKKWFLFAEPTAASWGTRRVGTPIPRRRKG